MYGKSWHRGNASRNDTNEVLTIYLTYFIPKGQIRVVEVGSEYLKSRIRSLTRIGNIWRET